QSSCSAAANFFSDAAQTFLPFRAIPSAARDLGRAHAQSGPFAMPHLFQQTVKIAQWLATINRLRARALNRRRCVPATGLVLLRLQAISVATRSRPAVARSNS